MSLHEIEGHLRTAHEPLAFESNDLLQHFLYQAHRFPDKIAISTPHSTMTYRDLSNQAMTLAQSLRERQISDEMPVAICLPPGIEQIVSQIGILMAGGSCVPLDPTLPCKRLNDMLTDLQVVWTIVPSLPAVAQLQTRYLGFGDLLAAPRGKIVLAPTAPHHRTHFLFTSGTTGKPKAVEIEAKSILRLVINTAYVRFFETDRVACIANPTFDASLFEIWGALLNGATLCVIPKQDVLNIAYFQQELIRLEITLMFMTTSLFNLIAATHPDTFRRLRYLLIGGETLNPHRVKQVLDTAPPEHMLNAYGPTECTTFALTHEIQQADVTGSSIPIGRPIDRTFAVILDERMKPVRQGETGLLYLGGEGLARSYWHRDALNHEKFVNVVLPDHPSLVRLYNTGDLASQRSDGVFLCAGRRDNQIKIRGHRIELEEIELQLLKSGQVRTASACLVNHAETDAFLAAFVVPNAPGAFNTQRLRRQLQRYLPEYMVPQLFVVADIPLTPTGKTDRHQLIAQLTTHRRERHNLRPDGCNPQEFALLLLWRNVLNNEHITLDDNFFHQGGSSLQAARLIIDLGRQFERNFAVQTLYDAPTPRKLARAISRQKTLRVNKAVTQWRQDARLPDDILPLSRPAKPWREVDNATVLLTGATGFLAAYLLRDLLALHNVSRIICPVRAADDATARRRIAHNLAQYGVWQSDFLPRIDAIASDFSLPQLGLDQRRYQELATQSDVVFHLGAHVNYIQPYQAHRASNIEGTLNILRLTTTGKAKALHYVSTIAAFGPAGLLKQVKHIDENDDLSPYLEGLKYDSGYSQSKWVGEQLIWQAQRRGVPLAVYRPGFIMGDSQSGAGNPKDFVARLIRGCIAIGAYPALPRQRKEFIPIDTVSAALLTIASAEQNLGRAYHLVPPEPEQSIDLEEFFVLLGACGYPLKKLPYTEWLHQLRGAPNLNDNPLMPLLPMLAETVFAQQTRWEVYENMPTYGSRNTQAALAAAHRQLNFTPMDKTLLARYLRFWQQQGNLPPPAATE